MRKGKESFKSGYIQSSQIHFPFLSLSLQIKTLPSSPPLTCAARLPSKRPVIFIFLTWPGLPQCFAVQRGLFTGSITDTRHRRALIGHDSSLSCWCEMSGPHTHSSALSGVPLCSDPASLSVYVCTLPRRSPSRRLLNYSIW